jgi:GNAT superfamily N-acetyltransferase
MADSIVGSDGEVVAWGWAELPGELMLLVDPAQPELVDDVLSWFAEVATGEQLSVPVLDAETHVIRALQRHGYAREDGPSFMSYLSRGLEGLPVPLLPTGFVARPVRGEQDLARRVAVHRVVWNPSRVTEGSYRNVMSAWPYRSELDWVVEAPDGVLAAQCLIWLDEKNQVGELEPVGTDPRFRRMGLGRAVCLAAMHALRQVRHEPWCIRRRATRSIPRPFRSTGVSGSRRMRTHFGM